MCRICLLAIAAWLVSVLPTAAELTGSPPEIAPKSLATRTAGVDWPQMLGSNRDSKSPEIGILTKWPPAGPRVVWSRPLGTGYSVGSVAYGRIYQFDKIGQQATLWCLNAETGEELWKFAYLSTYQDLYGYNDGPRCAPLVDGNRVYLYGVEGKLHCVNASTGTLMWEVDTIAEFGVIQNFFGVGSTPIVDGDLLLVMVGGSPAESKKIPPGQLNRVTADGSAVVAFDKFTGKVQYKIGDDLASYSSLQTATINGRRWGFAFCRGGLLGFEPQSGKTNFHFPWKATPLESVNASTPVVVGDQLLISETYGPGSALLQVTTGIADVVWRDDPKLRAKSMQAHWNTPVYHEGFLYGSSGRNTENAELRCIDWKSGKVQWSESGLTRTSLLFVDGHFVVLAEDGTLSLTRANPKQYELVAKVELQAEVKNPNAETKVTDNSLLKYPCWSAPILSHGLLYLRGADRLVCVELIPHK